MGHLGRGQPVYSKQEEIILFWAGSGTAELAILLLWWNARPVGSSSSPRDSKKLKPAFSRRGDLLYGHFSVAKRVMPQAAEQANPGEVTGVVVYSWIMVEGQIAPAFTELLALPSPQRTKPSWTYEVPQGGSTMEWQPHACVTISEFPTVDTGVFP